MRKILSQQILIILIIMFLPIIGHAQLPDNSDPDIGSAPIDGGLSILIAAGVGYGVKKMREKRKK